MCALYYVAGNGSSLEIAVLEELYAGTYTCVAYNYRYMAVRSTQVIVTGRSIGLIGSIYCSIVLCLNNLSIILYLQDFQLQLILQTQPPPSNNVSFIYYESTIVVITCKILHLYIIIAS